MQIQRAPHPNTAMHRDSRVSITFSVSFMDRSEVIFPSLLADSVNWTINKLLLPHNVCSDANHITMFYCSWWRPFLAIRQTQYFEPSSRQMLQHYRDEQELSKVTIFRLRTFRQKNIFLFLTK